VTSDNRKLEGEKNHFVRGRTGKGGGGKKKGSVKTRESKKFVSVKK